MLLRWVNGIKVWANAIKMPDQLKYEYKWISASYKSGIETHTKNYFKFIYIYGCRFVKFVTFTSIILNEES